MVCMGLNILTQYPLRFQVRHRRGVEVCHTHQPVTPHTHQLVAPHTRVVRARNYPSTGVTPCAVAPLGAESTMMRAGQYKDEGEEDIQIK